MKRTITYTFVGLFSPLVTLLLLPVYLKYLSTEEYVILSLSNSFIAVFSIFFNLKVDQAMRTMYYYETEDFETQNKLFQTLFWFQVLSFVVWLVVFLLIGNTLFSIIYKNSVPFFPYTFIIFSSFLINSLCGFYYIFLQNKLKVKEYSILALSSTILINGLQLICVYILNLGFLWFLLAQLFANSIIISFIIIKNNSLFKIEISKEVLKKALQFSIPFIPFLILYNIENQLDRFFIDKYLSVELLAKYAVLLSISSIIATLFNSVDNAIRPELFKILSEKNQNEKIKEQMDFYILIGLVSLSFLVFFGTQIHWFLNNPKYNEISIFFPLIGIAFLALIFLRFYALQLIYENKVHKMNVFSFVKIILMAVLFMVLIPKLGINGALITLVISNFLNTILFYFIIEKKVLPSVKIIFYCILFFIINLFLCIYSNTKLLSLVTLFMFILFGILFLNNYKIMLKNFIKNNAN